MKDIITKLLNRLGVNASEIVNVHVHLPLIGKELVSNLSDREHPLLPVHLLKSIIPTLEPGGFFKTNPGMHVLLAIEEHNIMGKACPIYSPNDYILSLARSYPDRVIPFGSCAMNANNAPDLIKDLKSRGFFGIKYHALEGYSLQECAPALRIMEEELMPLIVHLGDTPFPGVKLQHADPRQLIAIADKYPELRILITHFGTPMHFDAFWIASRYENIYMDIAEYPIYWTPDNDNPYGPLLSPLHIKRVGAHKIIFGTDFPMPTLIKDPESSQIQIRRQEIDYYLEQFVSLPDHYFTSKEKKLVLCENIWSFLGRTKDEIINSNRAINRTMLIK